MNLKQALRLGKQPRLALVGAGGKTSALFALARSFQGPVIVTTTTHLGAWQAAGALQTAQADYHLVISSPADLRHLPDPLEGVLLVTGPAGSDQRLGGLDSAALDALHALAERRGLPLLVEADGARQRLLKAPAPHEPQIPAWVDTVVVVAGLAGLGQPLDEETVHRPELFAALSGLEPGAAITPEALVRVLTSPSGGLKGIPAGARKVALLNQAESEPSLAAGLPRAGLRVAPLRIAGLIQPAFDAVILAALRELRLHRVIEPCAAIILAGGGSTRFGQPKMLLPWRGQPLIRHAVETALQAGFAEVIVVTGAVDAPVREALHGLPARVVRSEQWQSGQSASVRAGVQALAENTGAALFLLADQPLIPAELLRQLIQRHQETLAPVVAPWAGGRRANPVLFDRVTFAELAALQGDTGGRAVLERYPVEYLPWPDAGILFDIDTPEDYQQLLKTDPAPVGAVILAAGRSRRMGQPKLALPWGKRTVIGQVAAVLLESGIRDVVAVTGGAREIVEGALRGLAVRLVDNPDYADSEMITSLQVGLRALPGDCPAALVVLGDQPQIEAAVIAALLEAYHATGAQLVVPSYQMRRGHPWLVDRALWPDLLALDPSQTPRDFLNARAKDIHYVVVDTPSVLADLDTPEDYQRFRPPGSD